MANEWTLYTNEQEQGVTLVPTDCQPIHDFELSKSMNSPYFIKNNMLNNHSVNFNLFETEYCYNSWRVTDAGILNTGLSPSNFEIEYCYNSWYLIDAGILNTGLSPSNFETTYNWNNWYLDFSPNNDFEINVGPWEEILGAFANTTNIRTITVPDQITKLGSNAFRRNNLRSISIKNGTEYTEYDGVDRTFSRNVIIEKRENNP